MHRRDEEPLESSDRRLRGTALRIAGAGLASVLAFGVPTDGNSRASAGGPALLNPAMLPGFSTLPAGWPGRAPELETPAEAEIWSTVYSACERYGILDQAVTLYQVLWEESRLTPAVRSACGRYYGIGQFTRSTFRYNVEVMRRLGLIWGDGEWSPTDPAQAIEVMAWMWSKGFHDHWGPYRRVSRRLATVRTSARLN
jgi:hypothetical protein